MNHAIRFIKRIESLLGHLEHFFLAIFLCALIGVGTYQSIASHIFESNATWPFELIRYSVFFIAMLGAALAAREGQMIGMDFLSRLIPKRWNRVLEILIACFVIGILFLTIKGGLQLRETTLGLNESYEFIRPDIGVLALPVAVFLIALHTFNQALLSFFYAVNPRLDTDETQVSLH